MTRKYLRGAAYVLGERQLDHLEIPGFKELTRAKQVPMHAELMGLGAFFVTGDIYECASKAIGQTMLSSGVAPEAIDQVIFCSSFFRDPFLDRNRQVGAVLDKWSVAPRVIRGISGSGCTDVVSSIDLACALLELGLAHNILIVGIESFYSDSTSRLLSYALISDAAVSMIVSGIPERKDGRRTLEIVATAVSSRVSDIGKGMSVTNSSPDRRFILDLLQDSHINLPEITKIFGGNIFLPVKTGREAIVGFSRSQMYLDNVRRTGHCLGCDSVINLVDFGMGRSTDRYVLYAEAEGHAGCVVLSQYE